MTDSASFPLTKQALGLLAGVGIKANRAAFVEKMNQFHKLCSTWNLAAKLMSPGDLETAFDAHIADSLSLAPYIAGLADRCYIDIGSGGGFPGVPLAVLLPMQETVLVERSATKADYLRQLIKLLELPRASVALGQYPLPVGHPGANVYTARAVENSKEFDRTLFKNLKPGDLYLMQRNAAREPKEANVSIRLLEDEFTRSGVRRGVLYQVTR